MNKNSMFYIGLDLGDKHSYITILDQEGELIEESRLPTNKAPFQRKFSTLQPCRIAMEVGTHSRWTSQLLKELGHDVLVANARKLWAIYHNPRKGDRADAETLARLARLDPELLSPIHHRSPQAQADLAVLRSRDALVRSRTLLINHARDIVKVAGARLPSCSADSFARKAAPVTSPSPFDLLWHPSSTPLLPLPSRSNPMTKRTKSFAANATRKQSYSVRSAVWARSLPWLSYPGACFAILTLENPDRFRRSREVGPAIGLVPRRDQSGDQDPQLRITKTGDAYLRRLLVGSAQYILGPFAKHTVSVGPDCDLRRWGLKLADRGGKNAKKRAVVGVARKLAIVLHHLWKTGEVYDPFYQSKSEVKESVSLPAAA
jgi:transposase